MMNSVGKSQVKLHGIKLHEACSDAQKHMPQYIALGLPLDALFRLAITNKHECLSGICGP